MNYDFKEGLPLQPAETSWASWKCDGDPHSDDVIGTKLVRPAVGKIVSYAGCEGVRDLPLTAKPVSEVRYFLPA